MIVNKCYYIAKAFVKTIIYCNIFHAAALFLLIPYIFGPNSLFCSHPSLIVANSKPTTFCKLQGMYNICILQVYKLQFILGLVVHAGALIIFGFLIFHLSHLLHSLLQPHKTQILMNSVKFKRNAHIIEVAIVV